MAFQVFDKLNYKSGMAYSLNYLGEIYIHHGDYEQALIYLYDALKIRDKINDLRGVSNALTNIGIVNFELKKLNKALQYYSRASEINEKINYVKGKSKLFSLKGDIYYATDDFIYAKEHVLKALTIDREIKNKSGIITNLNKIGLIYLKLNKLKLAKESFEEALFLASESYHLEQKMLSYLYLSQLYSSINMYKEGLELLSYYIALKDNIYSKENMGRFANLQTLFVTNQERYENELLQREIEFSIQTNKYLFIISIVTLLIIILLISKFITQRRNNKLLNELNSSKDKFFSILAHDLKGPFQGLLGSTELLHAEYDSLSKNEVAESIALLHRVTRNVYSLLEGLLEWSRAQTGRIEYNPTLFKLNEEAERVVELLKENAIIKKISLSSEIDETVVIYADRNMVSTILRNLVTNGIKFSDNESYVKILAVKKKNEIVVTIVDDGIGMGKEEIEALFRIDIHHTTLGTKGEEGTGVGLILCEELVKNNGGKIWAESKLGEGSKFIFTLPSSKK